jgi:hypothetical protein
MMMMMMMMVMTSLLCGWTGGSPFGLGVWYGLLGNTYVDRAPASLRQTFFDGLFRLRGGFVAAGVTQLAKRYQPASGWAILMWGLMASLFLLRRAIVFAGGT